MKTDTFEWRTPYENRRKPEPTPLKELHWEARMACLLIERWGMIAGKSDGEDSAGRAKLDLMPPAEVVERACETAQLAVAEFERRGWVENVTPRPEDEADD